MQIRIFAASAVLSLGSVALAPAAAWAQNSEVEFHIEATATVVPDRASVPLTIQARGDTEAKAKAQLDQNEKALRQKLAGMGIKPSQISGPAVLTVGAQGEVQARSDVSACAAAVDMSGDDPAFAAAEATAAAAAAATDAADDSDCVKHYYGGTRVLVVEISDVTRSDALYQVGDEDTVQVGKATFSQSDPAAARRKARSDAISKARQDAEGWAEAMGYRITGIKRVSNTRPGVSLTGLFEFMGSMEGRGQAAQPSWFIASTSESVMIDFIAVPR